MTREYTEAGLPYPTGNSFVIDGDDDIQALAEALTDGRVVRKLPTNTHAPTDPPTAWPAGVSTMVGTTAGGWPFTCTVVTIRDTGSLAVLQFAARVLSTIARVLARSSNSVGWSPWAGAGGPYAQAAGFVSINTVAAGTATATVTFPAGLFSAQPGIQLTAYSGSPQLLSLSYTSPSTSSFVTNLYRTSGSGGVVVAWHAIQNDYAALLTARTTPAAEPDATVTCPTEDCGNAGVPITVPTHYLDDDGTSHAVDAVICGVCGTQLEPQDIEV